MCIHTQDGDHHADAWYTGYYRFIRIHLLILYTFNVQENVARNYLRKPDSTTLLLLEMNPLLNILSIRMKSQKAIRLLDLKAS